MYFTLFSGFWIYLFIITGRPLSNSVTFRNRAQAIEEQCRSIRTVIQAKPLLGYKVVELPQKPEVDREKEVGVAVDVIDHCKLKKTLNNVWSITNNSCRYSSLQLKHSFPICFYYFTVNTVSFLILK